MHKSLFRNLGILVICCILLTLSGFSSTNIKIESTVNLLRNGSFEYSNVGFGLTYIPGWRVVSGNIDIIPNNPYTLWAWNQSADGAKSLELIGSPGVAVIEQSFPTEIGSKYIFSGWVAHHFGIHEAGINVSVNGNMLEPIYHSGQATQFDMKWSRFTREFIAQSTVTTLRLSDRNLAGWEWGGAIVDGLAVMLEPDLPLAELLQNGSFEQSEFGLGLRSIPGWRVIQGNVDLIPDSADALWAWNQSADGTKSLELVGTPGAATITQSFRTQTGRKYIFTGWISHHFAINEAGVNVSVNGIALEPLYHNIPNSQGSMEWEQFTREFVAVSTITTLELSDQHLVNWEWGGAVIDGLSVVAAVDITNNTIPYLPTYGEYGNQTTTGIDSDRDSVSADIKHSIYFQYRNSERNRTEHRQLAFDKQEIIPSTKNKAVSVQAMQTSQRSSKVIPKPVEKFNIAIVY